MEMKVKEISFFFFVIYSGFLVGSLTEDIVSGNTLSDTIVIGAWPSISYLTGITFIFYSVFKQLFPI